MTAYNDAPVMTAYRNPVTKTVYVKTVPDPGAAWVAVARGHSTGRITSAAMAAIPGLIKLEEAAP